MMLLQSQSCRIYLAIFVILIFALVVPAPSSAYSYSISYVEDYDLQQMDMIGWGTAVRDVVQSRLNGAGWSQSFCAADGNVDETDFGSQNSGYQGLDGAYLHYHFGHGCNAGVGTEIQLAHWQLLQHDAVVRDEVYKKWDSTNKWVIVDACHVLEDEQWGGALKYSHGILGFASSKMTSTELPDRFFLYVIDYDYTIAYAWKLASQSCYDSNCVGAVIFDTQGQLDDDHLSGQGYVSPNEYPDDDCVYVSTWQC